MDSYVTILRTCADRFMVGVLVSNTDEEDYQVSAVYGGYATKEQAEEAARKKAAHLGLEFRP